MTCKTQPGPNVAVRCTRAGKIVDARTVQRRAERLLNALKLGSAELSIVLSDDLFIADLNRRYRNEDRPTDVLSFPMTNPQTEIPSGLLGDVVISVETAVRQARSRGCKPIEEVTALLIHGILHLVGHDHDSPGQRRKMDAETERLEHALKKSNLGDCTSGLDEK